MLDTNTRGIIAVLRPAPTALLHVTSGPQGSPLTLRKAGGDKGGYSIIAI